MGVLVDQKVLQHLVEERLPKLFQTLQKYSECSITLVQLIFKWLMVLFVGEFSQEVEFLIWDLFFIKGSTVLFRIALTVLGLI